MLWPYNQVSGYNSNTRLFESGFGSKAFLDLISRGPFMAVLTGIIDNKGIFFLFLSTLEQTACYARPLLAFAGGLRALAKAFDIHFSNLKALRKRWNAGTAFQGQKNFTRPTRGTFSAVLLHNNTKCRNLCMIDTKIQK